MKTILNLPAALFWMIFAVLSCLPLTAKEAAYQLDQLSVDGAAEGAKGSITIHATMGNPMGDEAEAQLIYSLHADATVQLSAETFVQTTELTAEVKHGKLERIELDVQGVLPIERVQGEGVKSWSLARPVHVDNEDFVRSGLRLIIELKEPIEEGSFTCTVTARQRDVKIAASLLPLFFSPQDEDLLAGKMTIAASDALRIEPANVKGLRAIESKDDAGLAVYL